MMVLTGNTHCTRKPQMSKILFIKSSPTGENSRSAKVAQHLVDQLQAAGNSTVVVRDLTASPLPHIGPDFLGGDVAKSEEAVQQLMDSDVVVIASGMINFGISSTLKAWIDHVARAGVTFRYTENGPEGLVRGKKVYLVQARGGVYTEGPHQAFDFQDPYLRTVLGFLGMTDVETIHIEGMSLGPEAAEKSVSAAVSKAKELAQAAA